MYISGRNSLWYKLPNFTIAHFVHYYNNYLLLLVHFKFF